MRKKDMKCDWCHSRLSLHCEGHTHYERANWRGVVQKEQVVCQSTKFTYHMFKKALRRGPSACLTELIRLLACLPGWLGGAGQRGSQYTDYLHTGVREPRGAPDPQGFGSP